MNGFMLASNLVYREAFMIDAESAAKVLALYQVEKLSMRQIAEQCRMCAKTVSSIIR